MAQTATAEKTVAQVVDTSSLRRFEIPDINRHQGWMIPRLRAAYPQLSDANIVGWLKGIIYSAEYCFRFQNNSVALFQAVSVNMLASSPAVQEIFVFCEDAKNVEHQRQAAQFYTEAMTWAQHHGGSAMIIEEMSDVPHEMIGEVLPGRLLTRQQVFCKVPQRKI